MQSLLKLQWPNNRIIIHTTRDHTHPLSFVGAFGPILFLCLFVSVCVCIFGCDEGREYTQKKIPLVLNSCVRSDSLNNSHRIRTHPIRLRSHWHDHHFFLIKLHHFNTGMVHCVRIFCRCREWRFVQNPPSRMGKWHNNNYTHALWIRSEYIYYRIFSHPLLSILQFKRFNREYLHIFYEVSIQKWHDTLHSILTALWADLRAFFRSSANISYVNITLQHACSAFKHNYTRRIEQFQLPRWKGKVPRKGHEPQKPMP